MQDPGKFLDLLFQYDKDNIPDAVIQKIQPYIDNEDFQPAAIAKVRWDDQNNRRNLMVEVIVPTNFLVWKFVRS